MILIYNVQGRNLCFKKTPPVIPGISQLWEPRLRSRVGGLKIEGRGSPSRLDPMAPLTVPGHSSPSETVLSCCTKAVKQEQEMLHWGTEASPKKCSERKSSREREDEKTLFKCRCEHCHCHMDPMVCSPSDPVLSLQRNTTVVEHHGAQADLGVCKVSVASLSALVGKGACAGAPRRLPGSPGWDV